MSGPTYSVCVCTYNDGDTVEDFFSSIHPQLDDRFEVVVVDGGSTDGTLEFFESQAEDSTVPIRIFDQEGNGLGRARQQAVNYADGEYLFEQIDADMVYADCFEEVLSFYHSLESEIGPYELLIPNLRITPKHLHAETGGWKPFPHGFQENETTRRMLKADKLRYLEINAAIHVENDHGFKDALRRFLFKYREKLRCGVSPWYALYHTLTSNLPWWRKLMDPFVILVVYLWGMSIPKYDTFDAWDPLAFDTRRSLRRLAKRGEYDHVLIDAPPFLREVCFDDDESTKVYSITGA